ncbi:hypothetical protein ACEPAI_5743 [Sanghuangporus weigelae]
MLVELPRVEYSIADCQDLFISKMDEDCNNIDIDRYPPSNSKNHDIGLSVPHDRGVRGHLSDAEPFYTSSSESDADMCFSDIEPPRGMPSRENTHSAMPLSESKTAQKDLALHSPGQLLGTPRDPSRRYEYPFPAHSQAGQSGSDFSDDGSSSSTASTPGLTPGEGSSLGLVALAATLTADLSIVARYASLRTDLPGSVPAPVPIPISTPIPSPIAVLNTNSTLIVTKGSNMGVSPLSQVSLVPGPSSAPALGVNSNSNTGTSMNSSTSSLIAAHPKLSRFNPANMPVPPGLRDRTRTRKSASVSSVPVSIPPQQGMVASISIPTSVSSVAAASAAQVVSVSSVVVSTTMVESS